MNFKILNFVRKISKLVFFKTQKESIDIFECVDYNVDEKPNVIKIRIN
jgi:hypothetical protein